MLGTNARTHVSQGRCRRAAHARNRTSTHDIEVGLRVHFDQIERNHIEEAYFMEGATLVDAEGDLTRTKHRVDVSHRGTPYLRLGV